MKFEFSRGVLMGLALAGLLTNCGGSGSWVESPDGWAQAPMTGGVSAPVKPQKPKKSAEAPKATATEDASEPKKPSWWNKKKGEEVAEEKPEKKTESPRPEAAPVVKKNGKYPTAERSKFFSSHVLSPYDNRSINVSGIASGTLVADPRYPLDQKKYFIVP